MPWHLHVDIKKLANGGIRYFYYVSLLFCISSSDLFEACNTSPSYKHIRHVEITYYLAYLTYYLVYIFFNFDFFTIDVDDD